MIDINKCEYEEMYRNAEEGFTVYYFTYPKDLSVREFDPEGSYEGCVCAMCISLTVYDDGEPDLQMSPTIEYEDGLLDVDWRDLYEDVHYTSDMIPALIAKSLPS